MPELQRASDSGFPHDSSVPCWLPTEDWNTVQLLFSVSFWRHWLGRKSDRLEKTWLRVNHLYLIIIGSGFSYTFKSFGSWRLGTWSCLLEGKIPEVHSVLISMTQGKQQPPKRACPVFQGFLVVPSPRDCLQHIGLNYFGTWLASLGVSWWLCGCSQQSARGTEREVFRFCRVSALQALRGAANAYKVAR